VSHFGDDVLSTDSIRNVMKLMLLSMQGAWLARVPITWRVVRSTTTEDSPGKIHKTRMESDGTVRSMSRTDHLTNKSMYLIGLISLHKEQLIVSQLRRMIKHSLGLQPRGGCVDCLFYNRQAKVKITPIINRIIYPDGSPVWKTKDQDKIAPRCVASAKPIRRMKSVWKLHDETQELPRLFNNESFGTWSTERRFAHKREWRAMTEDPGPGRGAGDNYQELAAQAMADNGGAVCIGQGGSGKSYILKRLRAILEERGIKVHSLGFTHVAAQNLGTVGTTILAGLHRYSKSKGAAFLIDEMSMCPLSMWGALAKLQMTGSSFYVFGDCAGQFLPIQDQHRRDLLDNLDSSDFIHGLTNGFRVEVRKFRRGGDMEHYDFVGSIRQKGLKQALGEARKRYPTREPFNGTTLVIAHRTRERINGEVNLRIAPADSILVEAGVAMKGCANRPQQMRVWVGIVLVAVGTDKVLKNGLRYKLLRLPSGDIETFCVQGVDDDDALLGEATTEVTRKTLADSLRLTHALCYFSCQARTIRGPLRLADTGHNFFTFRHLTVGCGRGPCSSVVEVE
jgi:hypothetical protein